MKKLLILAFLALSAALHAQKADNPFAPKLTGELYVHEGKHKGSVFFNDRWVESTLLLSTGDTLRGVKLKYQGFLDEVVWYNTVNYNNFIIDKAFVGAFWTTDSLNRPVCFKHIQVRDSGATRPKDFFAQVAYQGRYTLYIQRRIVRLPDETIVTDKGLYAYTAYGPAPVYYIQLPDGSFRVLRHLNRIAFLSLFPERKKELAGLIRKHGIRMHTEKGLTELIRRMSDSP